VRAQVRKATAAGHQRAGSALSIRRDSPLPRNDGSGPATPITTSVRPNISRNTSANTTVLTHHLAGGGGTSPRLGKVGLRQIDGQRRRLSSLPITSTPRELDSPQSPGPAETDSGASSSSSSPAQSRIIRRPPRFQQREGGATLDDDDDDDDAEPAFFRQKSSGNSAQDLGATLKGDPKDFSKRLTRGHGKEKIHQSHTSDSSASSAAIISRGPMSGERRVPGPLSPRRQKELAGKSPSGKAKGYSRDSDGTPSMGSSFSDLDGTTFSIHYIYSILVIVSLLTSGRN
jgi:hypothetical protein